MMIVPSSPPVCWTQKLNEEPEYWKKNAVAGRHRCCYMTARLRASCKIVHTHCYWLSLLQSGACAASEACKSERCGCRSHEAMGRLRGVSRSAWLGWSNSMKAAVSAEAVFTQVRQVAAATMPSLAWQNAATTAPSWSFSEVPKARRYSASASLSIRSMRT